MRKNQGFPVFIPLWAALCVVFLQACTSQNTEPPTDNTNDIYTVLGLVLDDLVGSDSSREYLVPPPIPLDMNALDATEQLASQQREMDSIRDKLDSAVIYVFIKDTLTLEPYIAQILKEFSNEAYFKINVKEDSSFFHLFQVMAANQKPEAFSIDRIKSKYDYRLLPLIEKDKNREIIDLGFLDFSAISFNPNRTKACVYGAFHCGSLCGVGRVYFLKKLNGRWRIVKALGLWVS